MASFSFGAEDARTQASAPRTAIGRSALVRALSAVFHRPSRAAPVPTAPIVSVAKADAAGHRAAARAAVAAICGDISPTSAIVLYAPIADAGTSAGPGEWRHIAGLLARRDAVVLVRVPADVAVDADPGSRVRMVSEDVLPDIVPLLPGIDALVTDFSPLAFDAGRTPMPVVHIPAELDAHHVRRARAGRIRSVTASEWAFAWADALADGGPELDAAEQRALSFAIGEQARMFRDGAHSGRLYRTIRRAIERARGED